MTYLGNRVGCHKTEDVRLDTLVELNHRPQLSGVERARLVQLYAAVERLASHASDDVAEITRKLVPQAMVNVKLALTRRR